MKKTGNVQNEPYRPQTKLYNKNFNDIGGVPNFPVSKIKIVPNPKP